MIRIAKVTKKIINLIYICIYSTSIKNKYIYIFNIVDFSQSHEYNKAYNQIPNKLFAMSQNTNLKKKVHNYGIGII